jgi:hypothetical protein
MEAERHEFLYCIPHILFLIQTRGDIGIAGIRHRENG